MISLSKAISSSVGKKIIMALTGLGLVVFIILHLSGNILLYSSQGTAFNGYTYKLHSWGNLLYLAEIGLLAVFLIHIYMAMRLNLNYRAARPERYKMLKSKGGHSMSNLSSRNMIVTGLVLFAFLILHVLQFRFGAGESQGYVTDIHGEQARDLYRLVMETFHQPLYVAIYSGTMIFLGFHLRHGFWSAFQSLGAMNSRYTKPVYALGIVLAIILSLGFLVIPLWVYFDLSNTIGRMLS